MNHPHHQRVIDLSGRLKATLGHWGCRGHETVEAARALITRYPSLTDLRASSRLHVGANKGHLYPVGQIFLLRRG